MTQPSFLGTGWSFPPTFTKGGADLIIVSGPEDIHQSLQILLSTQLGERVMREDFGCDLNVLLFEEVDQSLVQHSDQNGDRCHLVPRAAHQPG